MGSRRKADGTHDLKKLGIYFLINFCVFNCSRNRDNLVIQELENLLEVLFEKCDF
jgi:hypothetical protein